jgi:ATP-dependent Clp protease ATP-binding subunit ClpA
MSYIEKFFAPEFRNRLDAIIQFASLDIEIIKNVVDKFLTQLQGQLDDKKVSMLVTDAAKTWLAEKGYDRKMGARPMARVIQENIKKPLAEQILFGELAEQGGEVVVDVRNNQIVIETSPSLVEATTE